jgi:hypothetical protein
MMAAQKEIAQSLNNTDNAQKLNDLAEDTREAMMGYQVRTPEGLALITSNVCFRHPYNGVSTKTPVRKS